MAVATPDAAARLTVTFPVALVALPVAVAVPFLPAVAALVTSLLLLTLALVTPRLFVAVEVNVSENSSARVVLSDVDVNVGEAGVGVADMLPKVPGPREKRREEVAQQAVFASTPFSQQYAAGF